MAKMQKEMSVKVLQYFSDSIARFTSAPISSSGRITLGNMSWDASKTVPDYLIYKKRGRGNVKEPFFILRPDIAVPVDIRVGEQSSDPQELKQLIENENLKSMTKLDKVEVDKSKMYVFGLIFFIVGFVASFLMWLFKVFTI